MDVNDPSAPTAPQDTPVPSPTPVDPANAIVLNVLSPSSEVPGGRITFPRIHLDTKLSQLKTRIGNVLPAAPAPERQRLIYRGHALLNADLTLRQVLRPAGSTEPHSNMYTLHLVLPPGNASAASVPTLNQPAAEAPPPAGLPQPPTQPALTNGPPNLRTPQQIIAHAQAQAAQVALQLNLIQQQFAGQNNHHGHHHAHTHPNPAMPGTTMLPNGVQVTYQIHHHGPPGQQVPGSPSLAEQHLQRIHQQAVAAPAPQFMPTSGEAAPNEHDAGTPGVHDQGSVATTQNSDASGLDAQGQTPRREVISEFTTHIPGPNATNRPASTGATDSQPPATASTNPFIAAMPGRNPQRQSPSPALGTHLSHGRYTPMPLMMPPPMPTAPASPATTMAWILSSPSGPEALLFAPGHGFFSSAAQPTSARLGPTRTIRHRTEPANQQPAGAQNAAAAAPPQPPQPGQALARLHHPQPAAEAEENAFLNFIVARGWLFLRLYVFTFFISEPNTWRRYMLLAVATFICILPRDNFLQRGMAVVVRHVDALVGPPGAPGAAPPAQDNDNAAAPGVAQPPANITPAENAVRLLHEHEARNPNVIRDVLFRIERAVAMFLASLVPGVGERHVRAREDQRREAERRVRVESERVQAQDASQVGGDGAGSTAVETRDGEGEARERTAAQAQVQAQRVEAGA